MLEIALAIGLVVVPVGIIIYFWVATKNTVDGEQLISDEELKKET